MLSGSGSGVTPGGAISAHGSAYLPGLPRYGERCLSDLLDQRGGRRHTEAFDAAEPAAGHQLTERGVLELQHPLIRSSPSSGGEPGRVVVRVAGPAVAAHRTADAE